jgi:Putative beta-lactamase-inhibitor-like, PepSY-like
MRIILLLFSQLLSCQLSDPPAKVIQAFNQKYPNAKEVSWNADRNARHEAEFKLGGIHYRADFKTDGTWVETETTVKWKDLPAATKESFKKESNQKAIVEIELVDSHEKGKFYDIEYKISVGKQDILITPDGKILSTDNH